MVQWVIPCETFANGETKLSGNGRDNEFSDMNLEARRTIGDVLAIHSVRNEEQFELSITGVFESADSSNSPWPGI